MNYFTGKIFFRKEEKETQEACKASLYVFLGVTERKRRNGNKPSLVAHSCCFHIFRVLKSSINLSYKRVLQKTLQNTNNVYNIISSKTCYFHIFSKSFMHPARCFVRQVKKPDDWSSLRLN